MTVPEACFADHARQVRCGIVSHRQVAAGTWRIRLDCPDIAARAMPGQFAMLRIPDRCDPLLARPLAVYDVFADAAGPRHADFVYAVHGKFTTALTQLRAGDELVAWGPLGNGFPARPAEHLVLVAGGIGQTALLALARERLGRATYGTEPRPVPTVGRVSFCWGARPMPPAATFTWPRLTGRPACAARSSTCSTRCSRRRPSRRRPTSPAADRSR
jgi:dihydroorotate dehydrogenase electron transfer subunit